MKQLNFPLTKDLIIPSPALKSKGFTVFPAGVFGLTYNTNPDPRKETVLISLNVIDLQELDIVHTLNTFNITEAGFPFGEAINQVDIDAALAQRATLEAELVNADIADIAELERQLSEVTVPDTVQEVRSRYSEVISFFNGNGTITEQGIEWAKTAPLGAETVGDYI